MNKIIKYIPVVLVVMTLSGCSFNLANNDSNILGTQQAEIIALNKKNSAIPELNSGGMTQQVAGIQSTLAKNSNPAIIKEDISANEQSTIFYTQTTANVRSCASTSCDSMGTYPINSDFTLPYASINDLPEWIELNWLDGGKTKIGYINKNTLGENKVIVKKIQPAQQQNTPKNDINKQNQISYREQYIYSCGFDGNYFGTIYCSCLYDYLSQYYSDSKIATLQKPTPSYQDPELVNALSVCDNRFKR